MLYVEQQILYTVLYTYTNLNFEISVIFCDFRETN